MSGIRQDVVQAFIGFVDHDSNLYLSEEETQDQRRSSVRPPHPFLAQKKAFTMGGTSVCAPANAKTIFAEGVSTTKPQGLLVFKVRPEIRLRPLRPDSNKTSTSTAEKRYSPHFAHLRFIVRREQRGSIFQSIHDTAMRSRHFLKDEHEVHTWSCAFCMAAAYS
jgi:hypothetical protein